MKIEHKTFEKLLFLVEQFHYSVASKWKSVNCCILSSAMTISRVEIHEFCYMAKQSTGRENLTGKKAAKISSQV